MEAELMQIKSQLEKELKQTTTALTEASAKAAAAYESLAEVQTAHATQMVSLKSDLTAATQKAHELELEVVRTSALLESKAVELPPSTGKKTKAVTAA
jgi:uncharacterized protein YhaN